MSRDKVRNVAASVRQKLLNQSRERGEDFQLLLTRYALERFLYRLSRSVHRDRFILKGAMLFALWEGDMHRVTRDVDLLGFGPPAISKLETDMQEICETDVEDDGMLFLSDQIRGAPIREDQEYEGVRIAVPGRLDSARVRLQIDVGFGDAITPQPEKAAFPTILEAPAPVLRTYPRETVVAEKLQAMVMLGRTVLLIRTCIPAKFARNRGRAAIVWSAVVKVLSRYYKHTRENSPFEAIAFSTHIHPHIAQSVLNSLRD